MTRRVIALVIAALMLATACSGSDDPAATDETTAPEAAAATEAPEPTEEADPTEPAGPTEDAAAAPATESADGPTEAAGGPPPPAADAVGVDEADVVVTGVDYAFEGLPEEVAAGTTVAFTNDSEAEVHELVLVRLPDDETRPVEEVWPTFEPSGPPARVSVAAPGEEGQVFVGDGTLTEPGRYIAICFIPVGADPEEVLSGDGPPESDSPPHAAEGMVAELVVS